MKIYIDADGCPVTKITVDTAKKYNIECVIVCDTSHIIKSSYATVITVSKGADSADFKIANLIEKDDILVTQDYGLAAICLSKKAKILNQNGIIFNDDNILLLLNNRADTKKMIKQGKKVKGPKKRTKEDDDKFLLSLLSLIEKKVF